MFAASNPPLRLGDQVLSGSKDHLDGTHRSRSPRATVEKYWPLRSHFGITRLANITGLDFLGVPVFQGVRPNAKNLSVSQGKGLTVDAARASALMEAIEGWHAEELAVTTCFERHRTLAKRARVIDLSLVPRRSPWPSELSDTPTPWVEGIDLVGGEVTWVPYDLVSLDRTRRRYVSDVFTATSSGLASGNNLAEAVLHGLCEVIEHDAHALWELDPTDADGTRSLVDLDTVDDPACQGLIATFRNAGLTIAAQDITSDVGVPAYQCVLVDDARSFRPLGYAWGQGCHPNASIALLRALTEAPQSRLTRIAGARDDQTYETYASAHQRSYAAGLVETLRGARPTTDVRERRSLDGPTFEADLRIVVERLRSVGITEIVVVNLTNAELGVPVVKVIVPGLESIFGSCLLGARGRRAAGGEVLA